MGDFDFIGLVAVLMGLSIPLSAIWTTHLRKSQQVRVQIVKDEIELERLKYDNFILETEKLRLDLQQKQTSLFESTDPVLLSFQQKAQSETKISID